MTVLHERNKKRSLVMEFWKINLQFPTATNNKNTAICNAPMGKSLPLCILTCGKVNNMAPTMIPP